MKTKSAKHKRTKEKKRKTKTKRKKKPEFQSHKNGLGVVWANERDTQFE